MYCTKKGGDRQELHEAIREHSVACAKQIKQNGAKNDLLDRILADPKFNLTIGELAELTKPETFIGCAPMQTEEFLENVIRPLIEKHKEDLGIEVKITV